MQTNQTLIYKAYTSGTPVPGETLLIESRPFDTEAEPPSGGITVKNLYISLDPYQRNQIRLPTNPGTYSRPWVEGCPAEVVAISSVIKSDNSRFKPNDLVLGFVAAGEYAAVSEELVAGSQVLPLIDIPLPVLLNIIGVPGMSAYVSFMEYVPQPRAGKTMYISAASGAVGQIIGQLGKMHGMRVIGSTGSAEKVDFVVNELGYDAAWNYKTETTADALARLAPEGLDVYYDNVGGEQFETAITRMKDFGTIIVSGMISQFNTPDEERYGVKSLMHIVYKRLSLQGFVCSDEHLLAKHFASFEKDMLRWTAGGKIKTKENVVIGLSNAIDAWLGMLSGDNFGKTMVKLSDNV
ncbi:putative zinc-type alcohol dehydrogenase-like protein PB24D3.08c [Nemania sp. FL0031]|nr:putative zinc-type alcohol dehydrogenase-like protein PB24D3.08c [Nemania sp. FL0031]